MPERPSMGTLIVAGFAISKGKCTFPMRGKSDIFYTTFTFGQSGKSPYQSAYSTYARKRRALARVRRAVVRRGAKNALPNSISGILPLPDKYQ
jgi:hypothetical protein